MINSDWFKNIFFQYEYCVGCKERTKTLRATHIELRKHYIEGIGQLCDACYISLFPHRTGEYQAYENQ